MLPSPQQFHDLINSMESEIVAQDPDTISVLKWANLWNNTGLIGLNTGDMGKLVKFRDYIHAKKKNGMVYAMVPKELVTNKTTITTLLKYNYRDYNLETLPGGLFRRNPELDGSLVVTKSRTFGVGDKTIKGESKDGWRYVEMEADATFMALLEDYSETHRFSLGSDSIQIWGGRRRPDPGQAGRGTGNKSRGTNPSRNGSSSRPNLKSITIAPATPTGRSSNVIDLTGSGTAPGTGVKNGNGIPGSIHIVQRKDGAGAAAGGSGATEGFSRS